jgi:hypothetical protein
MLLLGGIEAMSALHEMQNCYVTANSMAVVLLAQTFIEHSLAGGLILAGEDETAEAGWESTWTRSHWTAFQPGCHRVR